MRVGVADDSVTQEMFQNTCELVSLAAPRPILIQEVQIGPEIDFFHHIGYY